MVEQAVKKNLNPGRSWLSTCKPWRVHKSETVQCAKKIQYRKRLHAKQRGCTFTYPTPPNEPIRNYLQHILYPPCIVLAFVSSPENQVKLETISSSAVHMNLSLRRFIISETVLVRKLVLVLWSVV